MSSPRWWCKRRIVVLPFTQFLARALALAHANVPWLCNQVKVAQAPSSSSSTDGDSRTVTPSTMVPRRYLRHPSNRPDMILLHERRYLPTDFAPQILLPLLIQILFFSVFYSSVWCHV